jgi:hypothetical protein
MLQGHGRRIPWPLSFGVVDSITGRFIVEGVFWIRARVAALYPEK